MKVKEFINRHKKIIVVGACLGGAAIIAVVARKLYVGAIASAPVITVDTLAATALETPPYLNLVGQTKDATIDFLTNVSDEMSFAIYKEGPLFEIMEL